jgi:hypothetical protein
VVVTDRLPAVTVTVSLTDGTTIERPAFLVGTDDSGLAIYRCAVGVSVGRVVAVGVPIEDTGRCGIIVAADEDDL